MFRKLTVKMKKHFQKAAWAALAVTVIMLPRPVYAIPPPDFLIQVASQFTAFFAVGLAFVSALLSVSYQFVKVYVDVHRRAFWLVSGVVVIVTSLLGAYVLDRQYQRSQALRLSETWLEGSVSGADQSPLPDRYQATPAAVSNTEFEAIINGDQSEFLILDAREDIEFELGHIPESLHIRSADLVAGAWSELPTDKTIYVICFSGMRGKEIVDFLRAKGLAARYLEKGAFDWVEFGGKWEGEVVFYKVFAAERYWRPLLPEEREDFIAAGAVLIDAREPSRYLAGHPDGAINIAMLFEPRDRLEERFAEVDLGTEAITICDDLASCFDATVTGIELEDRGVEFLGIWNIAPEAVSS